MTRVLHVDVDCCANCAYAHGEEWEGKDLLLCLNPVAIEANDGNAPDIDPSDLRRFPDFCPLPKKESEASDGE